MTFEGKSSNQKLRVTIGNDSISVESLGGDYAGSVFTHPLTDLKMSPDLMVTGDSGIRAASLLIGFCSAFIALMSLVSWGKGMTIPAFWISLPLAVIAFTVMQKAPKKRVHLWSTKGGVQAFALEETKKNQESLLGFLESLKSSIASAQK